MPITKVEYRRLFSLGNYENESIGAEMTVPDGGSGEGTLMELIAWVELQQSCRQHGRNEEQLTVERLADYRNELRELEKKIESARCRWEAARKFLEKFGVNLSRIEDDIPF